MCRSRVHFFGYTPNHHNMATTYETRLYYGWVGWILIWPNFWISRIQFWFCAKDVAQMPQNGKFLGKTRYLFRHRPGQTRSTTQREREHDMGLESVWWSIYLTFLNCFWMKVPAFNWPQIKTNHCTTAMSIFTINQNVEKNGPMRDNNNNSTKLRKLIMEMWWQGKVPRSILYCT